ncbi:hypothetical protein [Pseudomonas sp. CGJS7]|uniref:hypothetical protein n=1 Tax=Pseudomonas sp. CGJS7 TaxID=3109348 RepID=UPI00300805E8
MSVLLDEVARPRRRPRALLRLPLQVESPAVSDARKMPTQPERLAPVRRIAKPTTYSASRIVDHGRRLNAVFTAALKRSFTDTNRRRMPNLADDFAELKKGLAMIVSSQHLTGRRRARRLLPNNASSAPVLPPAPAFGLPESA